MGRSETDKAESAWMGAQDSGWYAACASFVRVITFAYPITAHTAKTIARAALAYDATDVPGDRTRGAFALRADGRELTLSMPRVAVPHHPVPVTPQTYTTESLHGAHLAPVRFDN